MIQFAKAFSTPQVSNRVFVYRMIVAGMVILMAVAHLFTFEKFPDVMAQFFGAWAPVVCALIVVSEVAVVPYLLMLPLSPLAKMISKIAGFFVLAMWVLLMIVAYGMVSDNAGLLGATVSLPSGMLAFLWSGVQLALFTQIIIEDR